MKGSDLIKTRLAKQQALIWPTCFWMVRGERIIRYLNIQDQIYSNTKFVFLFVFLFLFVFVFGDIFNLNNICISISMIFQTRIIFFELSGPGGLAFPLGPVCPDGPSGPDGAFGTGGPCDCQHLSTFVYFVPFALFKGWTFTGEGSVCLLMADVY